MHHRRLGAALAAGAVVLVGCANGRRAGLSVHDAPDAGPTVTLEEAIQPVVELPPDLRVECTAGFDPMICGGACPARQGCCVTGIRPLGVCRTLEECGPQCQLDCLVADATYGGLAGLKCEALCTWLAPEPECRPRP